LIQKKPISTLTAYTCFEMRTLSRMFHGDNIFMIFYDILR
jgi:hypothetical protein